MWYYEILNKETLEKAEGYAKNFQAMCEAMQWKPWECKCISKSPIV